MGWGLSGLSTALRPARWLVARRRLVDVCWMMGIAGGSVGQDSSAPVAGEVSSHLLGRRGGCPRAPVAGQPTAGLSWPGPRGSWARGLEAHCAAVAGGQGSGGPRWAERQECGQAWDVSIWPSWKYSRPPAGPLGDQGGAVAWQLCLAREPRPPGGLGALWRGPGRWGLREHVWTAEPTWIPQPGGLCGPRGTRRWVSSGRRPLPRDSPGLGTAAPRALGTLWSGRPSGPARPAQPTPGGRRQPSPARALGVPGDGDTRACTLRGAGPGSGWALL